MKDFFELREAVGDTALAFQTPQGTVTATKRNTKGMRGKQDGYSISLKTKSGKVIDLGSHPKPTKSNLLSIVKNAMQKESVEETLEESKIFWVKVGTGRDHMVVKVKADTKGAAVKKMKAKYPKHPVSLDRNQKQGQPAGALESVELEEGKFSAKFTDHTPNKDFNDLAKKHKVKVTHDKKGESTTIHGDEESILSILKTMYGSDWKTMYTKKGNSYVDESVKTEDKGQFIYAAKQAKAKGDSTFVFAGKTYNCEDVLENENLDELSAKLLDKAAKKADDESDKAHHAKDRGRAGKKYDQATKFHKGAKDSRRRAIKRGEKVTEDLDEAVNMGPWNRGAINKAMAKAGIKGPMAKTFIAALRTSGTVDEK